MEHTKRVIQQLFPKPPPKIKSDHQHIFPHCGSKLWLTLLDVRWECLLSCGNSFTPPKPHLHSTKATVKNRSKLGTFLVFENILSFLLLGATVPVSGFLSVSQKIKNFHDSQVFFPNFQSVVTPVGLVFCWWEAG